MSTPNDEMPSARLPAQAATAAAPATTAPATATPAPGAAVLRAEHLGFGYPERALFDDLNFCIPAGLTLVRGGDGAGKTTLLRLLAGELTPTRGHLVRPPGVAFWVDPRRAEDDPLTGWQWLQAQRARFPDWDEAACAPLIEGFDLTGQMDKGLYMLSTGTRRKLWLVAAFACGARTTLLDLPFGALDAPARAQLGRLFETACGHAQRAWVVADYEVPQPLAAARLAGIIDLGD